MLETEHASWLLGFMKRISKEPTGEGDMTYFAAARKNTLEHFSFFEHIPNINLIAMSSYSSCRSKKNVWNSALR